MRKSTFSYLVVLLAATLFMASCQSLKKMLDRANEVKYTVTPKVLEMHGERVAVTINGTFPAKFFIKKATLVITPTLKTDDGSKEKTYKSYTLQGESVQDNNKVIPFEAGGSFSFTDTIAYEEIYRMSDLELRIKASAGGTSANMASIKVADGIITTPRLAQYALAVDNANLDGTGYNAASKLGKLKTATVTVDAVQTISQDATIFFDLQQANVKKGETDKEQVKKLVESIKTLSVDAEKKFSGVKISSYASPDGPEKMNADLVKSRGKNANDYLTKELKKQKVEAIKTANFITAQTTPNEDWEGFQKQTQASSMKDKDLVLRVLSMYSDPIVREKEIKNIAQAYTDLKKQVLPQLRRSEIKISYETKQKTDAEMVSLASSNPDQLKMKELFHAAEVADQSKKIEIYKTYTSKYPNEWNGFNNLGVEYAKQNNLADAKALFEKAKALDPQNAMVLSNLGITCYAKGDTKEAEPYLAQAKTEEANNILGFIKLKEGKYREALVAYGATPSYGKALAQTLSGDNASAISTLKSVGEKNVGWFAYLKAVTAAKAGQDDECFKSLKAAVKIDATLKDYAKKDMEFGKYMENDTFKAIMQ